MSKRQVELNQQLARCALASDVLDLVDRHVDEFNVVNCGTALQRLAKSPDGRRALAGPAAARVDPLLAAAADLVGKHARHVESRQLASLLHACGKLGLGDRASTLVDRVETAAKLHASKFNPQELANAAWGAAKLGLNPRRDVVRELLSAIATSLERHASNPAASGPASGPGRDHRRRPDVGWTPQGVSNVAWSLATLGLTVDRADTNADTPETRGFRAVFAAVAARSRDFNPQEVANTLWAISRLTADVGAGADEDDDDDAGERASEPRAGADPGADLGARRAALALASRITRGWIASQRLEPQHAANISWACAKLHLAGDDVPGALADAAVAAAPRMNTQELSMTAWSAAAFGRSDAADALARAFAARAAEATPQQLATTARAFAKLGERRDALVDAVADALVAIVDGTNAAGAAPRKSGDADPTGDRTGGSGDVRLALKPQDVANLAWALAKLGCARRRDAFDALSRVARAHLKTARAARAGDADDGDSTRVAYRYTTQQLTMLTWAHGMLAHEDEGLLRACVKEIRDRLGEFNTRDLTNTAWALDALGVRASDKPKLIERFGRAARRHLDAFNSQELLKFLGAFERLGGNDAKLAAAVSAQRTLRYRFPAIDADVELSSKTPTSYRGTGKSRVDDSCGGSGRGNTGVTLWEGSFVLAEWLSRRGEPGSSEDVVDATDGAWAGATWEGKVGVELGAGLGLPSIVAAKLGVKMVATDGDDDVLELLSRNVAANTPKGVARVEKLVWGGDDPLAALGLDRPPDLLLASDVVYGNDPVKWRQLVKTMRDLSGPRTLVVVGNVQRYPVHHPMAETRFFDEATAEDFVRREVPTTGLHPDFRRTGGGSCVVHLFRRRPESIERARGEPAGGEEAARERKRRREGKEKKSSEGKEKKEKKKKK